MILPWLAEQSKRPGAQEIQRTFGFRGSVFDPQVLTTLSYHAPGRDDEAQNARRLTLHRTGCDFSALLAMRFLDLAVRDGCY